jgi:hypothetical protein
MGLKYSIFCGKKKRPSKAIPEQKRKRTPKDLPQIKLPEEKPREVFIRPRATYDNKQWNEI